jgi:hypothetical protein
MRKGEVGIDNELVDRFDGRTVLQLTDLPIIRLVDRRGKRHLPAWRPSLPPLLRVQSWNQDLAKELN